MHLRTDAQTARSKRGFTLLEIVVAIGLMALAFAIGFTAVRVWRTRTGVRAAAQRLMADLAWARQSAMTTGSPVGLFFSPSAAGPGYHVARAEAGLTGETALERTVAFDDDEGLVVWCGQWEGTTTSNDFPASAGATDPAAKAWLDRGSAQWRSVAFTANGLPMSVNMPHASGTRYIAVCSGAEGEGDALRAAGPSYTIDISPMGQMSMREGIPGFQTAPDGLGKRNSPAL
ncbi:MAG: prepilin-type N-terminal cleavage/methylation domain-containing protein, partial [Proteobacteria bacterium]|nr:prepilin-type N-terminal cleavage/methylation domain-containing protein [Pseudomonadota bacterium]